MQKQQEDLIPMAAGLININQRCWFNTLMQGLLTSSQFISIISSGAGRKQNELFRLITSFISTYRTSTDGMVTAADSIYLKLTSELDAMSKGGIMAGRQNCLGEALGKLLDKLNAKEVQDLFSIKYSRKVHCDGCGNNTDPTGEVDNFIRLQAAELYEIGTTDALGVVLPELRQKRFENWLRGNQIEVPDYKCDKCATAGKCMRQSLLTLVSDVMLFMCDTKGLRYWFPMEYNILRRKEDGTCSNMTYKLTAVFHHNGGTSGGHWNCDCLRRVSQDSPQLKFMRIDDTSISMTTQERLNTSPSLLMYCYYGDDVAPTPAADLYLTDEEARNLPQVPLPSTPSLESSVPGVGWSPGYPGGFDHLSKYPRTSGLPRVYDPFGSTGSSSTDPFPDYCDLSSLA